MKILKNKFFIVLIVIVICLLTINNLLNSSKFQNKIVERITESRVSQNISSFSSVQDTMQLSFCGIGSPLASESAQNCIAVKINNKVYLFDVGSRSEVSFQTNPLLNPNHISAIFITHAHSDHIAGLGEINLASWVQGRKEKLPVYGSPEIQNVIDGYNLVYKNDTKYRTEHHNNASWKDGDFMISSAQNFKAITFEPSNEPQLVFNKNGVKVYAVSNSHFPVEGSVGYKIVFGGRSITISGDTDISENIFKLAENGDVLIYEAMFKDHVKIMSSAAKEAGSERISHIFNDILSYHADVADIKENIKDRNTKLLVLSHFVPPVNQITERKVKSIFKDSEQKVLIASEEDMLISLPANSEEIIFN